MPRITSESTSVPFEIWDGDFDTGIQTEESADEDIIRFDVGDAEGTAYGNILKIGGDTTGFHWNDDGNAVKFRFESGGDANLMLHDGINDTVAFGTETTSITINGIPVQPKIMCDRAGGNSNINFVCLSNQDQGAAGAFMVGARARGFTTSPTTFQAVQSGDRGLVFRSDMYDGSQFITNGFFQFVVDGTVSTGIVPSEFQIAVMDTSGNLNNVFAIDNNGDLNISPVSGTDITLFNDGGIRANRNQNSDATADIIFSSANYIQPFRVDVSEDEVNFGDNGQGTLCSMEASTLTARFNRSNDGANIVVESSSAGVDLWQTDTTNDLIDHNGGLRLKTTRITSGPYTLGYDEHTLFVDTDGGAVTVNLPAGADGQTYRVINTGSSGNDVTITPNGAELLVGVNASDTLSDADAIILTYEPTEGWY